MIRATRVDEALTRAEKRLGAAGLDDPRREARLLLGQLLGLDRGGLLAWSEAHREARAGRGDDLAGRRVATLVDGVVEGGEHLARRR